MAFKGNDNHTPTVEESHIADNGKIVGIDIKLELRLEVKGILVKKTSIERIVTRHTLDLCRIQKQPSARLGNVGKTDACESCDILAGSLTVSVVLLSDGFGAHGTSVIAENRKAAFHKCAFSITSQLAVQEEQAFISGITTDAVAERFLQKESLVFIKAIEFVDSAINPIIRFKGNSRNTIKILHSQFQILSLISFTFREMFDADLVEKDSWKTSAITLKDNFWKYYVYDILSKYWSEGGTTKIHSCNSEKRYLSPLTKGMFSTAFDNYVEYCNNLEEARNVRNPNEKDYVILNTIYLSLFTAMDQLSLDAFDVEHIATKSQMKGLIKKCKGAGLPISHIANICYLPEGINRTKRDLNFYQDTGYLAKAKCSLQYIEEKYSFTEETMLEWMDLPYEAGDFATLKEEYFEYLSIRCAAIRSRFLVALGFSIDEPTTTSENDTESVSVDAFTDTFFRLEKIGVVAKKTIEYLITNNLLSNDDFENLKSKDYCMQHLGCAFPLFVYSQDEVTDNEGINRYWTTPIQHNGKSIYVCSQWFEHDRKRLVPWVKKHLQ